MMRDYLFNARVRHKVFLCNLLPFLLHTMLEIFQFKKPLLLLTLSHWNSRKTNLEMRAVKSSWKCPHSKILPSNAWMRISMLAMTCCTKCC